MRLVRKSALFNQEWKRKNPDQKELLEQFRDPNDCPVFEDVLPFIQNDLQFLCSCFSICMETNQVEFNGSTFLLAKKASQRKPNNKTSTMKHGRPQTFLQERAKKFQGGPGVGGQEPTFFLKNNKIILFSQKSLKTHYFWPARGRGGKSTPCPPLRTPMQ
jgi:hypothetical protein